ncbi:MAG TPA: ABC transporter ATP-binding protein [Candidatus Saccharimonadales bacterium]
MKKTLEKQLIKRTLFIYWQHAWKYKALVIGLLTVVPTTVFVFTFLPPLIFSSILQRLSDGEFIRGDLWGSFGSDLVLYAGVCLLGGVILWRLTIFLIWRLEMNVTRDLYQRIFGHLMQLSSSFHANRFSGSLVSQSNKFTGGYVRIADSVVFDLITLILAFVFTFAILWPRSPLIVLIMASFSVVFIATSILVTAKIRRLNAVEATKSNQQTGFLADAITNVMAVKSFAGGHYEEERYARATNETRDATNTVMWASIKRETLFASITTSLGVATLVTAVASIVLHQADIATIFLVVTYTAAIGERLWEFSQRTLRNLNRAFGDAQDMAEILGLEPAVRDIKHPEKPRIKRGAIEFQNMTFTHPENDDSLFDRLNITIQPGEKIGLVGRSGSGKTSLTKLLLRFNDIDSGKILIDGQNIAHLSQDDLRRHIAYVPQEPLLFHRTIRENIAYGRPEASEEEIKAAAHKANASEFIEKLASGYDTLVGERGVKLSGGQRQRIAIARAILKDAPILVLDEATSALDSESEKLIQAALWELMKKRTAIVIAHRLSTIQKMDRILVMEAGEIIEQGSHAELVNANGTYAQLWAHQTGGFLEE